MKQFYVLQGQTKRMHPLVKIEDVFIIEVPIANMYAGRMIEIKVNGKQMPVTVPTTISMPLLPVFDYETETVKTINSSLLLAAISREEKDFLRHDYIITGMMVGLYTVEVIDAPLDPEWQVPTDEELKQFGEEYQQRKIEKMKELNNER